MSHVINMWRMEKRHARSVCCLIFLLVLALPVMAELKALDDQTLSDVTGQAFITIDQYNYEDTDFLRVNLGLDIDIQTTIEKVELGTYYRWENGDMCLSCDGTEEGLEQHPSDIMIDNFSLGHIDRDTRELKPFSIEDPFIEFAIDPDGSPKGLRVGFGKAKGWLSGDIQSLTGNIDIQIDDTAAGLASAAPDCTSGVYSCFLGFLLTTLGPVILGEAPLQADAILINDRGEPDPVRADMVGVESGTGITVDGTGEINFFDRLLLDTMIAITPSRYNASRNGDIVTFNSAGCDILTVPTCFPLTNFGSFEIGRDTPSGIEGFFISAQTEAVKWAQTFENKPGSTVTASQLTGVGTYMNIPNNGVQVTLTEAMQGIQRMRTEYIDRGVGLF